MADTWGMMPKSQEDAETIEQAIARIVEEHNDAAIAHSAVGQAIDVHRQSEVIDHLADSIVADKIQAGQISLAKMSQARTFQHIDLSGITTWADGTLTFGGPMYAEIYCGDSLDTFYGGKFGNDEYADNVGRLSKNPFVRFRLLTPTTTYKTTVFGIGSDPDVSVVGFKFDGATLKTMWTDEDEVAHYTTITGVTITNVHNYEIQVAYGETITWLIDGVAVYQLSWPATITDLTKFQIYTKRSNVLGNNTIKIYQIFVEQDY